MESTTTDSMCRCCAAEGIFKDIKTSYHWMGDEEVYGDMLRECFDVNLVAVEEGGICEVCITQLRNAANFKKQVLHTEKKFKRHLDSRRFKPTEVKEELLGDNGNSSDEDNGGAPDSEDDEDYVPEFEIPIKTESPEETKSRKRAAKATTSRAKKSRTTDDEDKSANNRDPITIKTELEVPLEVLIKVEDTSYVNIKPKAKQARKVPSKKKTREEVKKLSQGSKSERSPDPAAKLELEKHRFNIRTILLYSNATPIRKHYVGSGYICCFCRQTFLKASDLKTHTLRDHDDETKNKFMRGTGLTTFAVKLDITLLCCKICGMSLDTLEQLIDHLNKIHLKGLFTDIKSHIVCFKIEGEAMKCHRCLKEFNSFKYLQAHMNKYFSNYICDACGAGFITIRQLGIHSDIHRTGTHKCHECDKVFRSLNKLKSHERQTHVATATRYRCFHCGETFKNRNIKKNHMIATHGVEYADLKCDACDRTFKNSKSLHVHKRKDHLMLRYPCKLCDRVFCRADRLKRHEVIHTGVREFKCEQCCKYFSRKCSLREHMRCHTGDRRIRQRTSI